MQRAYAAAWLRCAIQSANRSPRADEERRPRANSPPPPADEARGYAKRPESSRRRLALRARSCSRSALCAEVRFFPVTQTLAFPRRHAVVESSSTCSHDERTAGSCRVPRYVFRVQASDQSVHDDLAGTDKGEHRRTLAPRRHGDRFRRSEPRRRLRLGSRAGRRY